LLSFRRQLQLGPSRPRNRVQAQRQQKLPVQSDRRMQPSSLRQRRHGPA